MRFDPDKYHRRSIRLPGHDYRSPAAYFITICTEGRECILGEMMEGAVKLTTTGHAVQTIWQELPARYPGIRLDASIVMPNHVHGIVIIVGEGPRARPGLAPIAVRHQPARLIETGQPRAVTPTLSLPDVVHRFKSLTTSRCLRGVCDETPPGFLARLWQRNYYEHIIRNDEDLEQIRRYILENPLHWNDDPENVRPV